MLGARTTGLQAAHTATVAELEAWRRQFSPQEWAVLVDLLRRWLDREAERLTSRWAA